MYSKKFIYSFFKIYDTIDNKNEENFSKIKRIFDFDVELWILYETNIDSVKIGFTLH